MLSFKFWDFSILLNFSSLVFFFIFSSVFFIFLKNKNSLFLKIYLNFLLIFCLFLVITKIDLGFFFSDFLFFLVFLFFYITFYLNNFNKQGQTFKKYRYSFEQIFLLQLNFFILLSFLNCTNFVTFYLLIELFSIINYILVLQKKDLKLLKNIFIYFITGMLSSLLLLFGILLVYMLTGSLFFEHIHLFLIPDLNYLADMAFLSYGFIFVGLSIKFGIAPFHFWIIPVYRNIELFVFFYFLIFYKIFYFIILSILSFYVFVGLLDQIIFLFYIVGFLNLIIGGLTGVYQQTLRDILIFSSISSAGYIFYFFLSFDFNNIFWVFYYLVFYSFCLLIIFMFLQQIYVFNDSNNKNTGLKFDLNVKLTGQTFRCILVCLIFLMLIGMPPFILFFIKALLLTGLINYGLVFYGLILLGFSALNAFYYLNVIRSFFIQTKKSDVFLIRVLGTTFPSKEHMFARPSNFNLNGVLFEWKHNSILNVNIPLQFFPSSFIFLLKNFKNSFIIFYKLMVGYLFFLLKAILFFFKRKRSFWMSILFLFDIFSFFFFCFILINLGIFTFFGVFLLII